MKKFHSCFCAWTIFLIVGCTAFHLQGNAATSDQKGVVNRVLELGGDGDFVKLPSEIFNGQSIITVEGWVKWNRFAYNSRCFEIGTLDRNISLINSAWNSNLRLRTISVGGDASSILLQDFLTLGEWNHIAVVWRPEVMKLYFNGRLVGLSGCKFGLKDLTEGTSFLLGRGHLDDKDFVGQMDEFRVWNHERSMSQIQHDMHRSLKGSESGLLGLWNFDSDGVDSVVHDRGPQAHHGQFHGRVRFPEVEAKQHGPMDAVSVVSGIIKNPNGKPVSKAEVRASNDEQTLFWVKSTPAGRFLCAGRHLQDTSFDLRVHTKNNAYCTWLTDLTFGNEDRDYSVTLEPNSVIRGRVQAFDGSPISGVLVQLVDASTSLEDSEIGLKADVLNATWSDQDGNFQFSLLRHGHVKVVLNLPNHLYEHPDGPLMLAADTSHHVTFQVAPIHKGNWKLYTTSSGLPVNDLYDIKFDDNGLLWLATKSGLVSFDGRQFERISMGKDLIKDKITRLLLDREGRLWAGREHGVILVDVHRKQVLDVFPSGENGLAAGKVYDMAQAPDGAIWIRTREGLSKYQSGVFEIVEGVKGLLYVTMDSKTSILAIDAKGVVWTASDGVGLVKVDGEKVEVFGSQEGLKSRYLNALTYAPDGSLWFKDRIHHSSGTGMISYLKNGEIKSIARNQLNIKKGYVRSISFGSSGEIWWGTTESIGRYNPISGTYIDFPIEQKVGAVQEYRDIEKGPDGAIWIATQMGLLRFEEQTFQTFQRPDGLSDLRILDSKTTSKGDVYFTGTSPSSAFLRFLYHGFFTQFASSPDKPGKNPFSRLDLMDGILYDVPLIGSEDARGGLWLGGWHGYSAQYYDTTPASGPSFQLPSGLRSDELQLGATLDLLLDSKDRLWIAKEGKKVWRVPIEDVEDPGANVQQIENIPHQVNLLYEDSTGAIWLGGEGLSRMQTDNDGVETMDHFSKELIQYDETQFPFKDVLCLLDGKDGYLYVGTEKGLLRFDRETRQFLPFNEAGKMSILSELRINCAYRDQEDGLWFGTENGLYRYDHHHWVHLRTEDGLVGNQITTLTPDPSGGMWMGGSRGLTRYRPTSSMRFSPQLNIQIGTEFQGNETVALVEQGQSVAFVYSAIDYRTHPSMRTYRCGIWPGQLDAPPSLGDPLWQSMADQERFDWNASEAGSFTFYVYSIDRDMNRSPMARAVVNVTQPWHANAWIMVPSVSVMLGLLGWAIVSMGIVARRKKETIRLREEMGRRDHEARLQLEGEVNERRQAQELLLSLVQNVPILVFRRNLAGELTFVNQAGQQFWREKADFEFVAGKSWEDMPSWFTEEQIAGFRKCHDEVVRTGGTVEREVGVQLPGKGALWLHDIKIPIRDAQGNITAVQTVIWNITEEKEQNKRLLAAKEAADRANQAKSDFLANMSHEIRTPMNTIIGFTELLQKTSGDQKHRTYIDAILSSGKTMMTLINDILDLSKVEAGKLDLNFESVDVRKIVHEIETMFSIRAAEKGISLAAQIDANIPRQVVMDEVRIRQVLFNIVGNAVKFTEEGGIHIRVSSSPSGEIRTDESQVVPPRVELVFEIEDTGIGIPEDQHNEIFGSFNQAIGQDNRKYGGTGLGLSIGKRLTELMHGRIETESKVGRGTKFRVLFPNVEIREFEASKPDEDPDDIDFDDFEAATILGVDDVPLNQELLSELFCDTKHTMVIAENGKGALEKIPQCNPDVILMDLRMPVMDGYEAIRHLKSDPTFKYIPVIALTASSVRDEKKEVLKMFDGFVGKPIEFEVLYAELKRFLAK